MLPDTDGLHQRTPRRGSAAVHKHYNIRMDLPCVSQIPPDSSSGCLLPACSTLSTPVPTAFWLHSFHHPFQPRALQLTCAPLNLRGAMVSPTIVLKIRVQAYTQLPHSVLGLIYSPSPPTALPAHSAPSQQQRPAQAGFLLSCSVPQKHSSKDQVGPGTPLG